MEAVVDFAASTAEVEKIAPLEDQPKGGRPPVGSRRGCASRC
jgi:hypothetical protein